MANMIPAEFMPYVHWVGGFLLFLLGLSYGYKFFLASFMGKMYYWAGLEAFSWYFVPMTILVTPLLVHSPPSEKNLIRTKTGGWIHLFWGPAFFLLSLMMMVAGADFMGLPGTKVMNLILTCGRPDVPPAIVYVPPFTYKFPLIKKARRTVFKLLTADIYMDKKKSLNAWEQSGKDVRGFAPGGIIEDEEAEDRREAAEEQRKAIEEANKH